MADGGWRKEKPYRKEKDSKGKIKSQSAKKRAKSGLPERPGADTSDDVAISMLGAVLGGLKGFVWFYSIFLRGEAFLPGQMKRV